MMAEATVYYVGFDYNGDRLDQPVPFYYSAEDAFFSYSAWSNHFQLRLAENRRGMVLFQYDTAKEEWSKSCVSICGWMYGQGPRIRDWSSAVYLGDDPMFDYRLEMYSDQMLNESLKHLKRNRQDLILEKELEIASPWVCHVPCDDEDEEQAEIPFVDQTIMMTDGIIRVEMADGGIVSGSPEDVAKFFNNLL
jgi:hypothetical protein